MAATEKLVEARGLTKIYGDTKALDSLSFELRRGEILGLLGANGAGKTTTLHILLGLLTPSSGEVTITGLSPFKHRSTIAQRINFSSAYQTLPQNLKVIENMLTFARLYGVTKMQQKISLLLELFELSHLRNRITGALSSGEKTKLNLAKCLLNDPVLLILDEPTASLDPDISEKVRETLKRIQREQNIGIIYTSHNMFEVENLCDRIIFIHQGRRIIEGTARDIQNNLETASLEQAFIKIARGGELITGGEVNS